MMFLNCFETWAAENSSDDIRGCAGTGCYLRGSIRALLPGYCNDALSILETKNWELPVEWHSRFDLIDEDQEAWEM